ncbi:hypothetical protein [Flavobacterium caseinilyticum]|uniref:DUF262 domain-containing protein n=1 Tax=Flavobacterium caseinilyticum TaxID=2541732 RepID=A0A4R5AYE5_9FLAO|nr:hypothetical protein [Flavobacterium caseinilyticum]TDD77200.1 hypothetical protein E0F89_06270 [Flavobacterium caseinilyticum]
MYKLKILDCKTFPDRKWMLCKGSLNEYLESLKPEFYTFSIQRKIVKNQYLDTLITTIKEKDPIPVITLTYNDDKLQPKVGDEVSINMENIEILDGLQRTFRLWAHNELIKEYESSAITDPTSFAKQIKNKYPIFFETGIVSLTKIKNFYQNGEFDEIKTSFQDFDVYFVVWIDLTPKKVIHKMLVLNAGQRSVSKTHQFELLFLYLWEDLRIQLKDITLYREKESDANKIKSGTRNSGDYMFTSVIVALRSFLEKKPLRVSIDDLDVSELGQDESSGEINEGIFNTHFIKLFLENLKALDDVVIEKEAEYGKKWFVKDTTLSGILAGLGAYAKVNETQSIEDITKLYQDSFDKLLIMVKEKGFTLNEFTKQYNVLSSRSVNIGNFIRKVVMDYTIQLLEDADPSWEAIFNSKSKNG